MDSVKNCVGCTKPIEEGDFLEIDQGAFHAECFQCEACSILPPSWAELLEKNLAGVSFIPVDDHIFCEDCYYEKQAPKCEVCKLPIKTSTFLKIGETTYHRDCFVCSKCKSLFKSNSIRTL